MLTEWLSHLLTPAPRHLKRMGYLREAIALQARAKRCDAAWQPHLDQTKRTILEAAATCPGRDVAVILGAGLMLDVPLAELVAQFKKVVLVDIMALPTSHRIARAARCELIQADVTGCVVDVYNAIERREALPVPPMPNLDVAATADLVVSCNLASQLPVMPMLYAMEHGIDDPTRDAFSAAVIAQHFSWLSDLSATVCLIADVERLFLDRETGAEKDREDALVGNALPPLVKQTTWMWDIAPAPEAFAGLDLRFQVVGGQLQRSA